MSDDGVARQPAERDRAAAGARTMSAIAERQRVIGRQLDVAIVPTRGRACRRVGWQGTQQPDRRRIGGLKVVQDDEQSVELRAALRRNVAVESNSWKRAASSVAVRRRFEVGNELADLGKHLGEVDRTRAERAAHRLGVRRRT